VIKLPAILDHDHIMIMMPTLPDQPMLFKLSGHVTMLPSMMVMTLQFLALALAADQIVTERDEGTLARDWALGVPAYLALLTQLLTELLVVLVQVQLLVVLVQVQLLSF
jgi:hypothetical protein